MKRSFAAAMAILVTAGAMAAAAPPAADPPPIRLDAIITDRKARPIKDLKIGDFEIHDAGESRPVDTIALQSGGNGRLVAIFLDEYHVQAGESTDRARAALLKFVDTELRPNDIVAVVKPLDSLSTIRMVNVGRDLGSLQAQIANFKGRKGDYTPTTDFERNFMSRASGPADASRAQVVSSALQLLTIRLGSLREGRKSLVLLSEGFSPSLPRGSDRLMGSLRAIVYAANRYGVAIYPIDPRAPGVGDDTDQNTSTLKALAEQTSGEGATDHADMTPVLRQAATDLDDYYVVTYRAASVGDGRFHPVELRIKRADAQIRMRSGYWSAKPELLASTALGVPGGTRPMRPPHASPLIRPWIGTTRGPEGLTNVTVTWEPGVAPARNQRVGSVELKATSVEGQVLFDAPLMSRATFSATPGLVELEMTIRGLDGKTLDSDYRSLQIPSLRVTRLTLTSLQVMRTRSAREFTEASANVNAVPSASREFSRAERLLLRLPVYAPGDAVPTASATLLNRLGAPMRTLNPVTTGLPGEFVQFDLPLSSLAPDDYRVEVVATAASETLKTVLLFRVTN